VDLVIGIGNRVRTDDGVGSAIIESLGCRRGVECRVVHQLTPDLAQPVAEAERVLFVDASIGEHEMRLTRLTAEPGRGLGHSMSPAGLLDLAARLYEGAPEAWLLSVPGSDFGFGESLSPQTRARLPEAARQVEAWLRADPAPMTT
jgi:hydrogenase maturation protease